MENKIISRFLKAIVREEKHMKPLLLKCGLALALTFAGFLYSHMRIKRIKSSTTSPRGNHHTSHGSQVNSGGVRENSKLCSSVSEGNTMETHEEPCLKRVVSNSSLTSHSPKAKQIEEKDDFLLHEFNDHVKEIDLGHYNNAEKNSFKKDIAETPRSRVDSPVAYGSNCSDKDEHEQEIKQLRNMIRDLQERERSLEVQLLEYCGLREQEAAVMELQNRLKISSMEAKMFNLKVETLQSENRRLGTQLADHATLVAELDAAKTKVKFLKKKIKYEAEQSKDQIMNLKQKVSKLQDHESRAVAVMNDREIEAKIGRIKELEAEAEELRNSNAQLQMENSELGKRLKSTQILAQAVLEDPEADAQRKESERLMLENEGLVKEIEQLQQDRCSDIEELVYLRWINACLRHELRNYHPPPGKTVARDLSKSLSPKSEKKAKQLILEYAHNDVLGNIAAGYADSDQWSSAQASFSGEIEDYSLVDHASDSRSSHANKSKFIGKLMRLIRGRDKSRSLDDVISPRLSNLSFGNDGGCSTSKSEYLTPSTTRSSLDLETASLKEHDRRNSDSVVVAESSKRDSMDSRNHGDSFPVSPGVAEKSNLVKYAEALKDSGGTAKRPVHRRSSTFSSF